MYFIIDLTVGIYSFNDGILDLLFLAIFGLNFSEHVIRVPFLFGCNRFAHFLFLNCKS